MVQFLRIGSAALPDKIPPCPQHTPVAMVVPQLLPGEDDDDGDGVAHHSEEDEETGEHQADIIHGNSMNIIV